MKVRTELRSGAACYVVQSGDTLSRIAAALWHDCRCHLPIQPYHHRIQSEFDRARAEAVHTGLASPLGRFGFHKRDSGKTRLSRF